MTYTSLESFMEHLKQLIYSNDNPLINNHPSILFERPQFQMLYEELGSMIQTLFHEQEHDLLELKKVKNLKKRFKDAALEAEDMIDLFVSVVHFRNRGYSFRSILFKNSLNLKKVMRSIKSIKMEFMTMNIDNMKMDSSRRTDRQQMPFAVAAGTSCTRYSLGTNKEFEEIVVGLDQHVELIRDKLVEDQKQLDVISIVGMGGQGKTTLATKVYNDRFVVYHFHVRAWVTVSQTYDKRDGLIQILASMGVHQQLEEATDPQLREKLHKKLYGKRYLIVIDDIWSKEAWDNLKSFFPHNNTGSRILLTSRLNEVALHAKPPHGLIYFLPGLTSEQSWELLCKKVFHGDECPQLLIEPGMQIAKKCKGLPLAVVVIAGILANEEMIEDSWDRVARSVSSYFASDQSGYLEALALSYHHLPYHLRDCFLYLGGFPEDFKFPARKLIWLWVAEGFIQEAEIGSLEDTAEAYMMDLVDRSLLIVAERKSNGGIKACKVHDLVRELCLERAEEEEFFINREWCVSTNQGDITPDKQHRTFTNLCTSIVNFIHPRSPSIRSILWFKKSMYAHFDVARRFRAMALLRVLDLQKSKPSDSLKGIELLVHLRYLTIWQTSGFPSSICNLWSLQTLIVKVSYGPLVLPSNISDLVNLRHLWSNKDLYLPSIEKPMSLQTISNVRLGDGVENFEKCFPQAKKLACTLYSYEINDFKLLCYLETLKLRGVNWAMGYMSIDGKSHITFPATLKKLTLVRCRLPWSDMSFIQSLPNLEVLKLLHNAFEGTQWNACEQQFQQLKLLELRDLNLNQWEASSINFPSLKRLIVKYCKVLKEIPLEIGDISTLELIEIESGERRNKSLLESVERIQEEQHDVGNYELKITVDRMDLSSYLSKHGF